MLFSRTMPVFDILDELADLASASTMSLRDLPGSNDPEARTEAIRSTGEKAKDLMRRVSERLAHTFQPPIDPDDIHHLASDLREVVETVSLLAERLRLYKPAAVSAEILNQIGLLSEAAQTIDQAIHLLRSRRRMRDLSPAVGEIRRLRDLGIQYNESAISKLYDGNPEPLLVLEATELHDLAHAAMRTCNDIARTLERIAVKSA